MCHSVEMYMPRLTERTVEHRLGAADIATAGRARTPAAIADLLWARLCGTSSRTLTLHRAPRAIEKVRS